MHQKTGKEVTEILEKASDENLVIRVFYHSKYEEPLEAEREIEVYKFDKQLKNNFFYDDINLLDDGYFELSNRIGAIINKYLIQ